LNKNPNKPLDPMRAEFIKYVQSNEGQIETELGGFYSITATDRTVDMNRLSALAPSSPFRPLDCGQFAGATQFFIRHVRSAGRLHA
jgi:hypothetical protein